ncbi:transcriptional regulator [Burkholderia sp. Ch1-1]|nr:transcriptional regulator [Burkholderia sp. Ch1-1]
MSEPASSQALRLAVACETSIVSLSRLLALQRAEEPATLIALSEVTPADLAAGVMEGRFDAGLTLSPVQDGSVQSQVLWQDDLAVVVPFRSPLLAYPHITLEALAEYPVVMWCPSTCELINRRVHELLDGLRAAPIEVVQHVRSFDLMVTLVGAGYGIGFSARSHTVTLRAGDVAIRPLPVPAPMLVTHLVYPSGPKSPHLNRFVRRAVSIR